MISIVDGSRLPERVTLEEKEVERRNRAKRQKTWFVLRLCGEHSRKAVTYISLGHRRFSERSIAKVFTSAA